MEQLREALWRHYQREDYALVALGWESRGTTIDLACEKMGVVVFVAIRDGLPGPEEQDRLNRALCRFLRGRRASGVYLRWDRAWFEDGHVRVQESAFPVRDPDADRAMDDGA
jgi:hypothetical protein